MANGKMKTCKHCGAEIAASAKVCPHCGGKNKPPIFLRPWFIILAVLVVIGIAGGSGGSKSKDETVKTGEVSGGSAAEANTPGTAEPEKTDGASKEDAASAESGQTENTNTEGTADANAVESTAAESTPAEPVKTAYSVGDILEDGELEIVYAASGVYHEENEFMQPKEGNEFIFLKLAFANKGKSDKSISMYSFDAYADGYACDMHYSGEEELSATLSAGRSTIGYLYFEVPADAQDIEIEYEANVFTDRKIHFLYEGDQDSGYVLQANTSRSEGAYAVGDMVETKKARITYLSCEPYVSDNQFIQPKDGFEFITATLEFENTGSSDLLASSYSFDCYADGAACDQTFLRDDDLQATVSAGRKAKGTVTFEVPTGAEVVELEYNDNVWTSSRIVFTIR